MKVYVNEKEYSFDNLTLTVSDLLGKLDMSPAGVIAELNGEIVSNNEFANKVVADSSRIELIRIVGGG